jgi:hypothetical protein
VSHTTKLISRRRLSSQVRQSAQNKRDKRSHEAMATFSLDATGRPRRQTRQESRDGVVSITTNDETHPATTIIVAVASSTQLLCVETNRRPFLDRKTRADRANTCPLSPKTRASGSTKKAKTSSKNKRSRRDRWNARHAHDTRSTNSASESTGSVRDTVPNKTKQARGTTTANTILVDSTHKKRMWVVILSRSRSRARAVPQNVRRKKFGRRS